MIIHLHPVHPLIIKDVLTHYTFCVWNALWYARYDSDQINIPRNYIDQINIARYDIDLIKMARYDIDQIKIARYDINHIKISS